MRRFVSLALLAFLARSPAVLADDATAKVQAEVTNRLKSIETGKTANKPIDPDAAQLQGEAAKGLDRAQRALAAGRLYLGVEELGRACSLLGGATAMQGPATGFDATWASAKERLTRIDREAHAWDWTGAPAAVRALAESAQGKSLTLLEASRAYSTVTSVGAGLYYLGQANGVADFAAIAHGLHAQGKGTAVHFRSIAPELAALQHRVNQSFQPPRSIEMHPAFIQLNATLKTAAELDAAGLYAGALYQYLDAVAQLALIEAPAPAGVAGTASSPSRPSPAALSALAEQVDRSERDESLAELLLQRAAFLLEPGSDATAQAGNARRATAFVEQSLPAYFAVINTAPPPSSASASLASVNVTLVRWPYT